MLCGPLSAPSSVSTARQLQERHFLIIVTHNPNPKGSLTEAPQAWLW